MIEKSVWEAIDKVGDDICKREADACAAYDLITKGICKEFTDWLQSIIKADPGIQAISWKQYAPYFNDGDPCTFSVRDYTLELSLVDGRTWGPDGDHDGEFTKEEEAYYDMLTESISGSLCSLDEDLLESLCSDGKVIVSLSGVDTDEISHD
jgi:hypothetical protein